MKYVLAITAVGIMLLAAMIAAVSADPPEGKGKGNGIDLTGEHYNLNIIGKKSDWNGGGSYDNPDRHTMFVPEDTKAKDENGDYIFSYTTPDDVVHEGAIGIGFTRGDDFAVKDGNAFDDGWCHFQVGGKTYKVFICCKAKPGYTSDIGAWVYAEDDTGNWYYMDVGEIQVKGRKFIECTDLFYVSTEEDDFGILTEDMWVFDYLDYVSEYDFSEDPNYSDIVDAMYFWDLQNNGNKLIKLRFYPV